MITFVRIALIVLGLSATGCFAAPEDTASAAFASLCSGDESGFRSRLTADSRRLYDGLSGLDRTRFSCPQSGFDVRPADLPPPTAGESAESLPPASDGTRVIVVRYAAGERLVGLVEEDGGWKIDLFWGEESAFLPFTPLEEPQ